MIRKSLILLAVLALVILSVGIMSAQQGQKGKGADRDADKQAIDKLIKEQIQAFNNRDAAALAANWTAEGEYVRNDGQPIRGREEIQKGYAEFFKTLKGKSKLEVQADGLRFTSPNTAIAEVTLRLKDEKGEVIASSWRNTLAVRDGGQWKTAMIHEWDRDTGLDVSLKDLDWLIGAWHVANKDREVTTVYEWDEKKVFIRGKFTVKEKNKVIESGTQMIGKDNAAGAIHSWVFQADGGFGDGVWTRDGNKWSVDFVGVTPEGAELTATAIYVHVNADTYTWQSVNQAVNGAPIADTQPIKITRQK
jgi:uncharacterized protein (TIGR02246 family)